MTPQELAISLKPTRLDSAISVVSPKWAANRLRARREFSYEAARNTRLRKTINQIQGPEDYTAFPDRLALIRNVRDLEQNFGLFQSIIDKLALYAFGRMRYQSHTGDEATDALYEEYLESCFRRCDYSGRHNFRQNISIAFKSMLRDGDYALKWQRDELDGCLKWVGVEGDRLGGNVAIGGEDNYFQGITIDLNSGRPISYRVYRRTKANAYVDPVEVGASDALFLYDPRRYDQYRGITPFAPIINEARDLKEVLAACLIGTKFENMHAAVGYTDSGQPIDDPSSFVNGTELNGDGSAIKEQVLKAGLIQWAPTGSKIDFMKSDRPSANFQTYVDMLVRLQGLALNLPYGFIYSMLGTGPAVRSEMQQAQRTVEGHQENVVDRVANPAKNMWLMDGIASGSIPYHPRWFRGGWQFPAKSSIDAGRESQANIAEWQAGLLSKASIFNENGEDEQEQATIIAAEAERTLVRAQDIAKRLDIPLNTVLTALEIRTANGYLLAPADPVTAEANADLKIKTDKATMPKATPPSESEMARSMKIREMAAQLETRRTRIKTSGMEWLGEELKSRGKN